MTTAMKCLASALVFASVQHATAQLAPTGEHYAGRPSDTGYGGTVVNATATIGATIPLEFSPERGGLPVPLQIAYGTRGVGAAGLGWDLPLSFIQHNRTFAHRRPSSNAGELPAPRGRASLSLFGQSADLVANGNGWVARSGTLELTARESAGTWTVYDGKGSTYTFQRPPGLDSTGLFLLKSVSMPGLAAIDLTYQITTWPLDGGIGTAIDLIRIDYNAHPVAGCTKNQIALTYGNGSITPVSMSILGDKVIVRKNTLTHVDVSARATCVTPFERLRRYDFQYEPDTDTGLPRLHAVQMFGRQGTMEENTALPIATYDYGSATRNGVLQYQTTQTIQLPAGALSNQVSGTALDPSVNAPVGGDRYAMWQTLTDVTGDGRPDLVFKKNNKLWVAFNRPGANGNTTLGVGVQGVVQLADATFSGGAFATHTSVMRRFDYAAANRNTTNEWRQAIDVNGDGRIDIIDAAEQPDHWVVYLNTPDPNGVKWVRRSFSVIHLRETLVSSGHLIEGPYVPLSRRATGTDIKIWECWRWNGTQWQWYSQGFSNHRCEGVEQQVVERGSERTFVEWQLVDLNGDGYPDFVFNSSPVDFQLRPPPSTPTPVTGAVWPTDFGVGGPFWEPFSPRPTNEVRGSLNVRGVRFDTDADPFAQSFNLSAASAEQGVGQWRCVGATTDAPCDESFQSLFVGFADVNGDGLVDRVVGNRAYLGAYAGTAVAFSHVYITLPGSLQTQHNNHKQQCVIGGGQKPTSNQTQGMRDLTGDGIPDYFDNGQVWIGTGTGFRQPIDIATSGANFNFSHETETCNGDSSNTDGGLFDIDGDGRPEVIGLGGNAMFVSTLVGTQSTGAPEAGRLVGIDNGYGAKTSIAYVSAKRFTDNPVPFPEIVVSSVITTGTQNPGAMLAGSRYAYSNAELVFDSALDRFSFPGYRRRVQVGLFDLPVGPPSAANGRLMGAATITDTWPLTPFNAGLTKQQRWVREQRAGRVRDVFTLRGFADADPWTLLGVDVNDGRVIGVVHHEYDAKLYEAPPDSTENVIDCLDMFLPLDFALSFGNNLGSNGIDACRTHGFAFGTTTDTWYGASAPPSANNIQTASRALEVDDFGRVVLAQYAGDVFRGDDDVCVESQYATPNGTLPRVLSALASWRVTDCAKRTIFAAQTWTYDGLPAGAVSNGFATSHSIERRATDNGALLRTVHAFDATYDSAGNMVTVSTQRDTSMRTVTLDYDAFGLVPVHSKIDATGVASLEVSATYDPVSLVPVGTTDANQTQHGSDYDGFLRLVRSTVTPPGGPLGVLSAISYQGFGGGDPNGRRVAITAFSDPVAPADIGGGFGRIGTVFFDELGRTRRTEFALGSDYANELLVVGSSIYDALGRVVFAADTYPISQDPTTAYGTTYHYKNTGDLNCIIRGRGPQALNMSTDLASERLPTCFNRYFGNHVETIEVRDAASLQVGSLQAGVLKRAVSSAIGRPIEASIIKGGNRLDYVTFSHDRLGQQTSMTRFLNPIGTNPVQWSWRLDSAGQMLQLTGPETATRAYTYSDWGEPVQTQWTDGAINRQLVRMYDAMGRLTATEERADGIADPETVTTYDYDAGVKLSPQVTPTFVLGRLARASSPSGQVAFSYDSLGRVNAQTFADLQGGIYVQKSEHHADGTLAFLEFDLPDASYAPETVKYAYDSAGRVRTIMHADVTGARELYRAEAIDPFGRVRKALYGGSSIYLADYSNEGRRLMNEARVESSSGARQVLFLSYDALGREVSRREIKNGGAPGPKTNVAYDALGRLANAVKTDGPTTLSSWNFSYDGLGNVVALNDMVGNAGAALSYRLVDRDRACRIGYGQGGLGGSACNVAHDVLGNVVREPTRIGVRELAYFASGSVRAIDQPGMQARFRYDAFGMVQELNVEGSNATETRHDRRYGRLLERHDEIIGTSSKSILVRQFPGPTGIIASRRGAGDEWVFQFSENRGNRFFTDASGAFVQDVDYQPFGESNSSGVPTGSVKYTHYQWNGGDALASFNLAHLGARLYDPVIGRFLSRDPLLIPRAASTTNPYAFAMNDPLNSSDPSGLDAWLDNCMGKECNPDIPIVPIGTIINAIGSLFGGGSGGPLAAPPINPALAKALHDEAMYQAEQARICGKDPESNFCDNNSAVDNYNNPWKRLLAVPFSGVGVPSYYVKTEVSRAGMQNARTGPEYFAARDVYNAAHANVAMSRINEEAARYLSTAMSLSGAMMQTGAAGTRSGFSAGSRIPPNAARGDLTYSNGYYRGTAAAEANQELVIGKFPDNVNYVRATAGTVTLDVPSGWTPTYNAGFIRGFMDAGGEISQIRIIPGEFTGTFRIEVQQILTIPGQP